MTPPLPSPLLLHTLRAETRPYHDAVEQTPFNRALAAGTVTAADTAAFLAKMYGFLLPYEAALAAAADAFGPAWELPERRRAHLILDDLAALGYRGTPPLCPALPPLDTPAALLGALYVLEGSTLGGQVLARQLRQAGIAAHRYFDGYGPRTGPRWKTLCQLLEAAGATEGPTQIVYSAILTFQALAAWLHQS